MSTASITIRQATQNDVSHILHFIRKLAEYEKLADQAIATEELLRKTLFGPHPYAEVLIGEYNDTPAGFALFFHNYSTFLAKPGIYLEDLFVLPEFRGKGIGVNLLRKLAMLAVQRDCGRLEWSVLDWNKPAIDFYLRLGAKPLNEWTMFRVTGAELSELAQAV